MDNRGEALISVGDGQVAASEVRRSVGIPTLVERQADAVGAARVRVVGSLFLRWRPFIVAPVAASQAALMAVAELPTQQRLWMALALALLLGLFIAEAWRARRKIVTARWLMTSLALTAAGLVIGIALSGGAASPLLTLVLAPLVIAFAAFGRRRATASLLVGVVLAVGLVAVLGALDRLAWGPLPEPWLGWSRLVAFIGTAALTWSGVAGLSDAYGEAGRMLDKLRLEAIEEASSRLRSLAQVSAKVAHELKNPLAAVKALVQLERAQPEGDRSLPRLGVVLAEIDRMEALVRDYLAFTRPASELRWAAFDTHELLADVALLLSAKAAAGDVRIVVSPGGARLVADRARLREALFNLVDNAVRASPRGAVVELAHVAHGASQTQLEVGDRGPGMAPHIAAALAAGDAAYLTTRPDGSGLGLTIARAAVAQHGGRLVFQARAGGGTVARIELPATPTRHAHDG